MARETRISERMREARRRFLASCDRLVHAPPPAVTLLLAGRRQTYANAQAEQRRYLLGKAALREK